MSCPCGQGLESITLNFQGIVTATQDVKERARYLVDQYDFDAHHARRILCFGPSDTGPNMLVDCTKGVQNLHEVRDVLVAGFQWASGEV